MSPVRKGYPGPARNARQSTWDSAKGMFFPADVQTHISHILGKLGAKGRVEIVREVMRQGISA